MPTEPQKAHEQQNPNETPAQRDSRILADNQKTLAEIQTTLRQITDHLGITKKPMGALDPKTRQHFAKDSSRLDPSDM